MEIKIGESNKETNREIVKRNKSKIELRRKSQTRSLPLLTLHCMPLIKVH